MIPSKDQAEALWEKYQLPAYKRHHSALVAHTALFLANQLEKKLHITIRKDLLFAAALLHDIDKNIQHPSYEHHPDTAVRVLNEEGMEEVAHVVRTHPLHAILDQKISPTSWEEKLLYLSDKMVKSEIITVDKRFALWHAEALPPQAVSQLDAAYPKVKSLEREVCTILDIRPEDIASLA